MKIISLIDNARLPDRPDLRAEHGLSLFIETGEQRILFDTGMTGAFSANAPRLNVDLAGVTLGVLSHHHVDHGGGLPAFLAANTRAPIFLRSSTTEEYYLHLFGLFRKRVGLDESLFGRYPGRFVTTGQLSEVAPGVFVVTRIERRHPEPVGNRHLFVHDGRAARPDRFDHELILVVKGVDGLVVFTGCSHHGILNMLDAVLEQFPGRPIKAVFGGFHLIDIPLINNLAGGRAGVEALARSILERPVGMVYTGHCTGDKGYRILKDVMGPRLEYFATGRELEIPA